MTDIIIATYKPRVMVKNQIDEIEANTLESHRIIATCQPLPACKNRNFGLSFADSEIIVMIDDDITGFFVGWLPALIKPFETDPDIMVVSARLLDVHNHVTHMMGANGVPTEGWQLANRFWEDRFYRVCTACIAFRKNPVRYNENFLGSGYEDTSYMNRINLAFPNCKMVINNDVKLVHLNEAKEQGGKNFEHNKKTYLEEFPGDPTVLNQQDWTKK